MTQEDKELLLKDLCARLPYSTKVFYEYVDDLDNKTYGYSLTLNTWCIDEFNADKAVVKPYLRPMSSITDREEFALTLCDAFIEPRSIELKVDIYNKQHLDYRGLIEKGLAIKITEDNNPYNL